MCIRDRYGTERCTCTKAAVQQYLHRLSGPLLDRIDLQVAVQPVEYAALAARGQASEEHSADIRARVLAARERQYARQGADVCNAAIPPPQLAEHCPLSADASRMFAAAFQRLGPVSYTHLDVYKRQRLSRSLFIKPRLSLSNCPACLIWFQYSINFSGRIYLFAF